MAFSWTKSRMSRRNLAGAMGLVGVGAVGTALVPAGLQAEPQAAGADETAAGGHPGGHAASTTTQSQAPTADEMDSMHEAGVASFPAMTEGLGGQPLEYELDGDVKVFRLSCQAVQWEFLPGQRVEAWAYNGVVPGPEIRVSEGDKIRVHVTNESLPQSTAVHFHGLMLPNAMDGVPFITQPPIKLGETFTYEFQIRDGNAGTHMYHSHHNAAEQVTKGLLGAFIVEPKDPARTLAYDREYTVVLNDGPIGGFSINGKSFPATRPFAALKGERVLFRFMNEGQAIHPMHLHGMPMTVVARDGYPLAQGYMCDTLNIAPGERYEAIVHATEPGIWAFHCHVLSHAESAHGMFGMVSALLVNEE
jgi:FtsP/CotA-like multicopper oxidase with cupredoxin domain